MAEQNISEEVDLGYLYNKIKRGYNNGSVILYRKIKKNRFPVLFVIILGIIIGLYLNFTSKKVKEISLIVQINFDASNYVYNAVEQLNNKIKQNDTLFLKNFDLYDEKPIINVSTIEPIVNILDIIDNTQSTNSAYLKTVFEESKFEDDLLTSEMFISQYRYHRIKLSSSNKDLTKVVENFMQYLNSNDLFNKIKDVQIENTKLTIERNKYSIASIDSIAKVYGTVLKNPSTTGQNYYSSYELNNSNIHLLFREKGELLELNQELEIALEKYDKIIKLINKPQFEVKNQLSYVILAPLLLLLLYVIIAFFYGIYKRTKNLSNSSV